MKVCYLSSAASIHTVRWVNAMTERGHEVYLISLDSPLDSGIDERVKFIKLNLPAPFGYYLNFFKAKKIINEIKPDILHTHYASGYGTLSRLINYKPTILSVWGSDVYLYPYKSKINMSILKKNLSAPDLIASTSETMKVQTRNILEPEEDIAVTPFGIDIKEFTSSVSNKKDKNKITIGTIKKMETVYGIEYLLRAFKIITHKMPKNFNVELLLVGDGKELECYEGLAKELKIDHLTRFVGQVPHEEVPRYLNKLDIYCAPSLSESFGVAIIEASACELPVVVSNVGGLPEVVVDNKTGYIVPPKDVESLADKILSLATDQNKRKTFGTNGRQFVMDNYSWEANVGTMEEIYCDLLAKQQKEIKK